MEESLLKRWGKATLEELSSFVIGGDWGKGPEEELGEDYQKVACIRGSEIRNWNREKGKTASIRQIKKTSLAKRRLVEGDLLIEISGGGPDQPVGRVIRIDEEVLAYNKALPKVGTNFLRLLRPVQQVNSSFIHRYLLFFYYSGEVVSYQGGSNNLRNLKYKEYSKIDIPLPPLPEQKRIVAKLDALFRHLDELKKKLDSIPQLLKNFRQQVLTQAVTGKLTGERTEKWEVKTLNEISISITDGDHQAPPKVSQGVPFLVISNVNKGKLEIESASRFVPVEYYNDLKESRKPRLGDVLYTVTGSIGIPVPVDRNTPFTFQRHIAIIRPNNDFVDSKFLSFFLSSQEALDQGRDVATGTAQLTIPLRGLRSFLINLPSLDQQVKIVHQIESLFAIADKIEADYINLKAKIDALPQAILQKAFKGELVPQDPNDEPASVLLERIKAEKEKLKGGKK